MTEHIPWTGRVVKHLPDGVPVKQFGTSENTELLTDYYAPLTVVATEADEGKTIRELLEREFAVSSKLLAAARKSEYGLTINEERVYISAPVKAGEVIRLRQLREQSEDILPQQMQLNIVYEDDYLLIVNKPAGQVVHPTHGHYTNTLANGVVAYWQDKGERYRFRPIHRLDEETSGLVVIAKNGYIHQQLSEQLQQGKVDKRYVAFVYGAPEPADGIIEAPIARDPEQPHLRTVLADGAYAKTEYWSERTFLIGSDEVVQASLVRVKLYTGRTHQIRVHMHSIGHPLIGDKLYYREELQRDLLEEGITRHALHAEKISFYHPMSKEYMQWSAPLPPDFEKLIHLFQGGKESSYE